MGIIAWPADIKPQEIVSCMVCKQQKSKDEVTTGLCNAIGEQEFVCNSHFWNSGRLIVQLADFAAMQHSYVDEGGDGRSLY